MPVSKYIIYNNKVTVPNLSNRIITVNYEITWDPNTTVIDDAKLHIYVTCTTIGGKVSIVMNGVEVWFWQAPWWGPFEGKGTVDVLTYLRNGLNTFVIHLYNDNWFFSQEFYVYIELDLYWHAKPGSHPQPPESKPHPPHVIPLPNLKQLAIGVAAVAAGALIGYELYRSRKKTR